MNSSQQSRKATEIRRTCIAVRMRMANRVITKVYDDALRPVGLNLPQFSMLAFGESRGLLRQADLCAELQLDDSTLSRNLERMAAKGWLEEVPGEDGRERLYRLTPKGRSLLDKAVPAWSEAQEEARLLLGDSGVRAVSRFAKAQGLSS